MLSKDVKKEGDMSKRNNTIVLTGATGFLGSHLLYGLIQTGSYRVVVLKRSFSEPVRIAITK